MEPVVWSQRPALRHPVVIIAFEGWNDAGEAASFAARYLVDDWDATPAGFIDPEEFYDFTSSRPEVSGRREDRRITWPGCELHAAALADATTDALVIVGDEPQLRWRTFCATVVELVQEVEASMVVLLGALLSDTPHTRPVVVTGNSEDDDLADRLDLRPSRYEGPTGIVGVLHHALHQAGLPVASLWASVPTYVGSHPSPKAALALVERVAELTDLHAATAALAIASASYERQIDELVEADEDTAAYVARLELAADTATDDEDDDEPDGAFGVPDPALLIAEVERYLRDQPPGS